MAILTDFFLLGSLVSELVDCVRVNGTGSSSTVVFGSDSSFIMLAHLLARPLLKI